MFSFVIKTLAYKPNVMVWETLDPKQCPGGKNIYTKMTTKYMYFSFINDLKRFGKIPMQAMRQLNTLQKKLIVN